MPPWPDIKLPPSADGFERYITGRVVTIVVNRPQCPACGSIAHTTTRSVANGDDSRTVHRKCRQCDFRFRILFE